MRPDSRKPAPGRRPSRALLAVLLLACFTLITRDARGGDDSPLEPARSFAGDVLGPVESGTAAAVRPFAAVPDYFTTSHRLRADLAKERAANAGLRNELAVAPVDRNRVAELDGLLAGARSTGYALVPARVVAMGPAQSFSRTVTIDAGTRSGVHPDMTVLNNDGLVGRVLRADRSTATVLLLVDQESVVGGRLGSSMEVGFLRGRGRVAGGSRLDLDLVDDTADTAPGDTLVSWGSKNGVPYVAGIPIGRVTSVYSTPRQQSKHAVIAPFADFTSLDLVGVVVKADARSDRGVISADGTTRGGTP
jgi:rod shape-determining protein MreC